MSAPLADPVIACTLALGDVREKRGGEFPPYLSTHALADFLTALKERGWELTPVEQGSTMVEPICPGEFGINLCSCGHPERHDG